MIRFDAIQVRYDDFVAIPELDLTINDGEFFTFLGPSGCGKTTALRTLAGFIAPAAGSIWSGERDITRLAPEKRDIGMVFQNYALFPGMNVARNIEFGLQVRHVAKPERQRAVRRVAELVGLSDDQLQRNLDELSGGQQQRVAIARALVLEPKILLLDEPLSNLDAKLRQQMRSQLKRLQHEVGITTLYVTHDQDEAMAMSDRIAVFNAGRVDQVGTPEEIYDAAATEFVCSFVGDVTSLGPDLVAALQGGGDQHDAAAAPLSVSAQERCYLRPEKIALEPLPGRLGVAGRVLTRQYHGSHSVYEVQARDTVLRVMRQERGVERPNAGDAVMVWIHPDHVLHYPATSGSSATREDRGQSR